MFKITTVVSVWFGRYFRSLYSIMGSINVKLEVKRLLYENLSAR